MSRADRSYKDLKQKKKSAIADKTYRMWWRFLYSKAMYHITVLIISIIYNPPLQVASKK